MFQRLLVCTELTDGLQRLVHFVPALAAAGATQIVFLHVIALEDRAVPHIDEEKANAARERLSLTHAALDGVEIKVDVQWGKAADRILAAVKTHNPDVIVMGSAVQTLLSEKLFGSTTVHLCQRVTIPVLIIRPQLLSTYTSEELALRCRHLFRRFLIPYNGSKAAEHTIAQVKQIAQHRSPESLQSCDLCWVIETGGRRAALLEESDTAEANARLAAVRAELAAIGLTVSATVRHGEPLVEILAAADADDISAIACSSGSFGKLIEWSAPSFAGELLRRSWHPVLYFPPG